MRNEEELDEVDNADAQAFEEAWANWQVREQIAEHVITIDHLQTICSIWFGKGNARGVQWAIEMNRKVFAR